MRKRCLGNGEWVPHDDCDSPEEHRLNGEITRLREALAKFAPPGLEDGYAEPSGHCCPNCPWCKGEGWDPFVHTEACPNYLPDGRVRALED